MIYASGYRLYTHYSSVPGYDVVALGTILGLRTSIFAYLIEELYLMVCLIQFVNGLIIALLDTYIYTKHPSHNTT